jgi:hypothetical protein
MNSLALELIDEVIGHVDEKDNISRSHLLTCSLVCRLWLPSSQRRLFHKITLMSLWMAGELHAQIQRLDQVLLNSPHLTSYIRVLELPHMSSFGRSTYSDHLGWAPIDQSLSQLLRKLTQVHKLKVSGLPWHALPGDLRQSLCRVLELPSMAFVSIRDAEFICMDDFTNFINHANPKGLSLYHINTSWVPEQPLETKHEEDNKQRLERHCISHLTRLDMECSDNNSVSVKWLLGPRSHFDVSHIHTLHISLYSTKDVTVVHTEDVNRLLCAIGSSLKHVFIALPSAGE